MGIAWCRERVEQAQNSKSPVDRILVRCNNLIKPRNAYSRSQGKVVNDFVYRGMRTRNLNSSYPVPVHAVPPRTRHRKHQKVYNWKNCNFVAVDSLDVSKPPIPPPRKKRKRKINSAEVLNSEFPELCSPGYVIQSENLRNKSFSCGDRLESGVDDGKQTYVPQPPAKKSYWKEKRTLGHDRFEKLSRKRMRKIKAESYPKEETARKEIKNDGEKGTERKIKHVSTVSLPNYNELIKRNRKVSADMGGNGDDKNGSQSAGLKLPRRNSSAISLPGEGSNSILSSLSEATIHCLETYMKRCRSFGSLKPQQILEKLEEFNKNRKSPSESSDSWCGLDDWDLTVIEHCDADSGAGAGQRPKPPPVPSTAKTKTPTFLIGNEKIEKRKKDEGGGEFMKSEVTTVRGTVPLEWFLDPHRRHPAITASDAKESAESNLSRTPPPSPVSQEVLTEESSPGEGEPVEHSSLLEILTRYKGPETWTHAGKLASVATDDFQKDSMNFDELNVEFSSKQNLNPLISVKNRSNSLQDEKFRRMSLTEEKPPSRSPSNSLGCSTDLLRQLQNNKEAIEREILQRPNELLERLRRESLFRSVPKDAFEAFQTKKMTSLRESLNEFLGFKEGAGKELTDETTDDVDWSEASKTHENSAPERTAGGEDEGIDEGESTATRETPPMGPPIEITINSTEKKMKNPLFPNALVTFKENV